MESDLTQDEIVFLRKQNIDISEILDGRGLTAFDREAKAKREGKLFILAYTCEKGLNHRLSSSSGHCIQCKTVNIHHTRLYHERRILYMAYSNSASLIKIGVTKNIEDRTKALNRERLGDASDWEVLLHMEVDEAGRVEGDIHKLLRPYAAQLKYEKNGKMQLSRELFRLKPDKAMKYIVDYLTKNRLACVNAVANIPKIRRFSC